MNGNCPNCGEKVPVHSTVKVGYVVYCDECDAELEVINLKPVKLDYPLYDFDNDYDFDYDYEDGSKETD